MRPFAVIGTGSSAMAMAGHLAISGYCVHVWGRNVSKIEEFKTSGAICCEGAISGTGQIDLFTNNIAEALEGVQTILVTTPASAHADIAALVAPHVTESMSVILNPGRTGGLLEFTQVLENCGAPAIPAVAEAQTIIYTCRVSESNQVNIVGLKHAVLLASYRRRGSEIIKCDPQLPPELAQHFSEAANLTQTSIGNVGMVLHCAPTMLNSGWIECMAAPFKYYYQGISPTIASLLEKIDRERLAVAKGLGTEVESVSGWLRRSYSIEGSNLLECIRNNTAYAKIEAPESLQHRYLLEDVPCGLVPLECFGRSLEIPTPVVTTAIDMACALMDLDFRACGRNPEKMGIEKLTSSELMELFCS